MNPTQLETDIETMRQQVHDEIPPVRDEAYKILGHIRRNKKLYPLIKDDASQGNAEREGARITLIPCSDKCYDQDRR